MNRNVWVFSALAPLVWVLPFVAQASCQDEEVANQLVNAGGRPTHAGVYLVFAAQCYGSDADSDALVKESAVAIKGRREGSSGVDQVLRRVRTAIVDESRLPPGIPRAEVLRNLDDAIEAVNAGKDAGVTPLGPTEWVWTMAAGVSVAPSLKLEADLTKACDETRGDSECHSALQASRDWLRMLALVRLGLGAYSERYVNEEKALSDKRIKMWNAYRDEALPQYFWEYKLNSSEMERNDKRLVVNGNPQGPEEIPSSQWILLHPGASLEWRNSENDTTDNDAKPALYVEVFGRYRWSWDEATGDMRGGSGASLIVSYADREGRTEVGYGILLHSRFTKQFSLGITRAGGDTVYLVNVDLAEYFRDKLEFWSRVGERK